MLVFYGSPAYCLYLTAAAIIVIGVYFALKNRSPLVQDGALFALAVLNVFQHFFKPFVWRHLHGAEFSHIQTAYNVCACLILATPFCFLFKTKFFRQFICSVGMFAGPLPLLVPYWFIGKPLFQWEFARSFTCHLLLMITSLLPFLLKKVRFEEKNALPVTLSFFAMLALIFVNDLVCIRAGLVRDGGEKLWETMRDLNPFMIMGPSAALPAAVKILEGFSFGIKCGPLPFVPVLWYFLPIVFLIFVPSAALGRISDRIFAKKSRFLPVKNVHFMKKPPLILPE